MKSLCPFCGRAEHWISIQSIGIDLFQAAVRCSGCGAKGPEFEFNVGPTPLEDVVKKATELWSNRHD